MSEVFLVFREAIYRHECGGAFASLKCAEDAALTLLAGEPDDRHRYEVRRLVLGALTPRDTPPSGLIGYGSLDEGPVLTCFERVNGEIRRV